MKRRNVTIRTKKDVDSTSSTQKIAWPFRAESGPLTLAIIHIDTLIERIYSNTLKVFDDGQLKPLTKLTDNDLKLVVAHFKTNLDNIRAVFDGDPFFVEAYQNFSTSQLRITFEYLRQLNDLKYDAAASVGKTMRFGRAPRKMKKKTPQAIVKKVLFLATDKESGTNSLHPEVLVGAKGLWVYNSKTRKLGCYYARNKDGLTAKGTTILNYDEETSTTKTLRNPKEQVTKFMTIGAKFWDSIRSVPQAIPPRMSRETLILRVIAT